MCNLTVTMVHSGFEFSIATRPKTTITMNFEDITTVDELEDAMLLIAQNAGFTYVKAVECHKE